MADERMAVATSTVAVGAVDGGIGTGTDAVYSAIIPSDNSLLLGPSYSAYTGRPPNCSGALRGTLSRDEIPERGT